MKKCIACYKKTDAIIRGGLCEECSRFAQSKVMPTEAKRKGLVRGIVGLVFGAVGVVGTVLTLTMAFLAVRSAGEGGVNGIGAGFALVFLIIFGIPSLGISLISFLFSLSALLRCRSLSLGGLTPPRSSLWVGIIAVSLSVAVFVACVFAFAVGFTV